MGDMNGYTNTMPDYNTFDNDTDDVPLPVDYVPDKPCLRRNQDPRPPNARGKDILDLCKSSGMRILNGRKLGDITGKFTCYDQHADIPSTIDYAIADTELFDNISHFVVKPFTTFSDHCPIKLQINASFNTDKKICKQVKLEPHPAKFRWDNKDSAIKFKTALNTHVARK